MKLKWVYGQNVDNMATFELACLQIFVKIPIWNDKIQFGSYHYSHTYYTVFNLSS